MKTLYESILDDEDVLIGKTKELVNNLLFILSNIYEGQGNNKYNTKHVNNIIKQVTKITEKFDAPEDLDIIPQVGNLFGSILFIYNNNQIFELEFDGRIGPECYTHFGKSGKQIVCVASDLSHDPWRKVPPSIKKFIEEFKEKYNLEDIPRFKGYSVLYI